MLTQPIPAEFKTQMVKLIGSEQSSMFFDALQTDPSVSVRLNVAKPVSDGLFADAVCVPWCSAGRYLEQRLLFTADTALHAGAYYVQEASSMFHSHIVKQLSDMAGNKPLVCLDMCAAPGGKTTAMQSVLPQGSLMVANEFVPLRANILKENLQKWGYPNTIVTNSNAEQLSNMGETFDIVAVDAPCSGEGMMRKDEQARSQWSPKLVEQTAELQFDIVSHIWKTLKPGGYLIYSTCTFNRTENESMVERICSQLGGKSIKIETDNSWGIAPGIDTDKHCYRFMPHLLRGEGLFAAVIEKTNSESLPSARSDRHSKRNKRLSASKLPKIDWFDSASDYELMLCGDMICAIPVQYLPVYHKIAGVAKVILSGIEVAVQKGRDLIPQHATALSIALRNDSFHRVMLDDATATAYLRREAIVLPSSTPRGFVIVTDKNSLPLGFVKNIGNRSNNLYPQQWRVRMQL